MPPPHQQIFHPKVMAESNHPTDRGFRHGAFDSPDGDEKQHVGFGAGRYIDIVIPNAEPHQSQQILALRKTSMVNAGVHEDGCLNPLKLFRPDLRIKLAHRDYNDARLILQQGKTDVAELKFSIATEKIGSKSDAKLAA